MIVLKTKQRGGRAMTRLSGRCNAGRAVAVAVCMMACLRALSQTALPTADISVSTHLVQITVIVRDDKGPVNGLNKDDFTIVDQGKARAVSVFSIEPAPTSQSAAAAQPQQPAAQNAFSNLARSGALGGVTIILLDSLNTLLGSGPMPFEDAPRWMEAHAMASARQHLLATIAQLDPRDRIAVYALGPTPPTLRTLCDFTCSREELLAAVKRYNPSSLTLRDIAEPGAVHFPSIVAGDSGLAGLEHGSDQINTLMAADSNRRRGELTFLALDSIARHMTTIPGRKNLLWLTANLPYSGEAIAGILAPAKIAAYPIDARGLLPMADDPQGPGGQPTGIEAMIEMAADTGGHAYVNTNDLSAAIREVMEQPVAAYTIGFYVDEASVDGKFHAVQLKVDRPDVDLQYPRGYFATKGRQSLGDQGRGTLLAALRSPFDATAIPLDVTIARVEQPKPHMLEVSGSVGIQDVPMTQSGSLRTTNLDVYTIEQDAAGKVLHQVTTRMTLSLTADQYKEYLRSGVKFHDYVQPPKGTSVVRVLVRDPASQKVGSVVIPLERVN
jgi:VWFA-related protein